jgi:hypothetical protein
MFLVLLCVQTYPLFTDFFRAPSLRRRGDPRLLALRRSRILTLLELGAEEQAEGGEARVGPVPAERGRARRGRARLLSPGATSSVLRSSWVRQIGRLTVVALQDRDFDLLFFLFDVMYLCLVLCVVNLFLL